MSSVVFVNVLGTPQKEGYFRGQLLTLSDIFWTVRDDPCASWNLHQKREEEAERMTLSYSEEDKETKMGGIYYLPRCL